MFFSTSNKLLPGDVNGLSNVYEYAGGELHLISTGTSAPDPSFSVMRAPNGEDVFFITSQSLVASDTDNTLSLYDARVGGGFAGGGTVSGGAAVEGSGLRERRSVQAARGRTADPVVPGLHRVLRRGEHRRAASTAPAPAGEEEGAGVQEGLPEGEGARQDRVQEDAEAQDAQEGQGQESDASHQQPEGHTDEDPCIPY